VLQGAQLSQHSVVGKKLSRAGARSTSTVTSDAWPKDEDSPTTLQQLLSCPSMHAPQCDGLERLVWRAT
jgi:hypothetical protein